jgi:hypothetical protein
VICGYKNAHGDICKTRITHPMVRCHHHSKIDLAYVLAKQKAARLLVMQQDETKGAKSAFANIAFEHGLQSPLTIKAFEDWKAAKAAEGGPNYPAWFLEEGKKMEKDKKK